MDEQIKLLLSHGKKIHAMKLLKSEKGLSIAEAASYLKRLEREMKQEATPRKITEPSTSIERQVRILLRSGQEGKAMQLLLKNKVMKRREARAYIKSLKLVLSVEKASQGSSPSFSSSSRSNTKPITLNAQDQEKLERDTRQILRERGKVEAIKFLRTNLNIGLREGKELVDGLEAGRSFDGLRMKDSTPSLALPEELEEQVRHLLDEGRKIHAIKLVCETAGLGLRQGKEYVESL